MRLAKEVGPFPYLFDLKSFDKVFSGQSCVFIGHNRARTVGETTRKNAHPFMFDNILGAHNGTLDYSNKSRLQNGSDFKTDSEAIFNNIEVHGIENTIGKIEDDQGYALTWYDRRDHTINLLRNEHRPLWFIFLNNKRTLAWASEYSILFAGLDTAGITIDKDEKANLTTKNVHYSWAIPQTLADSFGEPVRNTYTNYKKVSYVTYNNNKHYGQYGGGSGQGNFSSKGSTDFLEGFEGVDDDDWSGYPFMYSDQNKKIPEEKKQQTTVITPTVITPETSCFNVDKRAGDIGESCIIKTSDSFKKNRFEMQSQEKKIPAVKELKNAVKRYDGPDLKVFRLQSDGKYIVYRFNETSTLWDVTVTEDVPSDTPFTILNIDSNHCFKHERKTKTRPKRIYYKGYRGEKLEREPFEKLMQEGCLNCERKPQWGNKVAFLAKDVFLCEFCEEKPGLRETILTSIKTAA